jgi:hypothetical protein
MNEVYRERQLYLNFNPDRPNCKDMRTAVLAEVQELIDQARIPEAGALLASLGPEHVTRRTPTS